MLKQYIKHISSGKNLSVEESCIVANLLLEANDIVTSSEFLSVLHAKSETADELFGFYKALTEDKEKLNMSFVDIVGTGGDNAGTLNISTGSALLVAAMGIPVVKHGNVAVSSQCGSADVLLEIGFKINQNILEIKQSLQESCFAFCFAQNFYPILYKLKDVRRKLSTPTVFNLLGPLLNPAGHQHIILGVYNEKYVEIIAEVLLRIGTVRSLVFYGNGIDEISCLGKITAKLVTVDSIIDVELNPSDYNLTCSLSDLLGKDKLYNAQMLIRTLNGQKTGITDSLVFNAGIASWIYGSSTIDDGIKLANDKLATCKIIKLNKLQTIIYRKYQAPKQRKSMKHALQNKKYAVIAEIKSYSPSAGQIAKLNLLERAKLYVESGAVAISILTDEAFCGSMLDMQNVARLLQDTDVPILCKDFILTEPQIVEAADNGADAILLIVHVLKDRTTEMVKFAHAFGLEVIVEIHQKHELEIAINARSDIIGINQRNLQDFSMHPDIYHLVSLIPDSFVKIAESGLKNKTDVLRMLSMGYDGVLIGEGLSCVDEPSEILKN